MELGSISNLWQHWTQEKWTPYECEQRIREGGFKGYFYTEGDAGGATASKFTFLKEETPELFYNKITTGKPWPK